MCYTSSLLSLTLNCLIIGCESFKPWHAATMTQLFICMPQAAASGNAQAAAQAIAEVAGQGTTIFAYMHVKQARVWMMDFMHRHGYFPSKQPVLSACLDVLQGWLLGTTQTCCVYVLDIRNSKHTGSTPAGRDMGLDRQRTYLSI